MSTPLVTLANNNTDRDVRRAFIPYAPLYPTFEERLSQFRQEGHAELFQRGAEQVVHNVGLFDTGRGRSSEERSSDFIASLPEGVVTPGPSEALVYEEQSHLPCVDMVSERGWLVLLLLVYVVAAAAVITAENITPEEPAGVPEEVLQYMRRFRRYYDELYQHYETLYDQYRALARRLGEKPLEEGFEKAHLYTYTSDEEAEAWEEQCQDLSCCLKLWWSSVGELFHQTSNLLYQFVWDPYNTGGHWATRIGEAGFWGPVVGCSVLLVVVNLLLWGVMRAADIWKGMRRLTRMMGNLPMFAIWGPLIFGLRGVTWDKTAELQRIRKEIQQIKKKASDRERKKKEEGELRDLREEIKNLQAGYGQQETTAEGALNEMRDWMGRLQTEISEMRRQQVPAPPRLRQVPPTARQGEGPRSPRGTSPTPPQWAAASRNTTRPCPDCGKWHPGECWSKPCAICKRTGMCEHRARTTNAYRRRAVSPGKTKSVSTCSALDNETRLDELLDMEARLIAEDSQTDSSISFTVKKDGDQGSGSQDVVAATVERPRKYHIKGHLVVGQTSTPRTFLLDTGADVNLLSERTCEKLGVGVFPPTEVENLKGIGGEPLRVEGQVTLKTRFGDVEKEVLYFVVHNNERDIIGAPGLAEFDISLGCNDRSVTLPSGQKLFCHVVQKN